MGILLAKDCPTAQHHSSESMIYRNGDGTFSGRLFADGVEEQRIAGARWRISSLNGACACSGALGRARGKLVPPPRHEPP